ncbi:hypothetical protein J6590_093951 [Homalodisca vitripennis]|nr:hypothetical protein J6590_093951 [Homalodisca vitripennis]
MAGHPALLLYPVWPATFRVQNQVSNISPSFPQIFVYRLPYAMKDVLIDMSSAINNSTGARTVEWHGRPPGAPTLSCLACHVPSTESDIRLPTTYCNERSAYRREICYQLHGSSDFVMIPGNIL